MALQRTAVGLESVAVVPGAFMALRRPPRDGRPPGAAANTAARVRWRLLQVVLLLQGLVAAPLAWLPRLGDLRVTVTFAEHRQPPARIRLQRDEATIFVHWRRRDRSRRAR